MKRESFLHTLLATIEWGLENIHIIDLAMEVS
jgi:hypothetical protein